MIAYVTDVEGCSSFWHRYVDVSQVLTRNAATGRLELAEGAHFVFGGDAVDQGSGDLSFLEELRALREDHPGRVHYVLGNRDINKMRLPRELSAQHARRLPWSSHSGVVGRGDGRRRGGGRPINAQLTRVLSFAPVLCPVHPKVLAASRRV